MNKTTKFSPEVRDRAVRIVQEHRGGYPTSEVCDFGRQNRTSEGTVSVIKVID